MREQREWSSKPVVDIGAGRGASASAVMESFVAPVLSAPHHIVHSGSASELAGPSIQFESHSEGRESSMVRSLYPQGRSIG